MEPFVHNAQHSILICTSCQYAVVANEVTAHLRNHHGSITAEARGKVARLVGDIPSIVRSQTELESFQYPDATVEPIAHIAPPQVDGLRCYLCRYMCRRARNLQEHCRAEHGWENNWQKGGNVPRREPVVRGRAGFGVAVESSESAQRGTDDPAWFVALHDEQEARFEAGARQEVSTFDEKLEPNGWLYRVGWTRDLEGLNKTQLQDATRPIEDGKETLRAVWAVWAVFNSTSATAAPHKVGQDAL
ncbi:hypothetical protein CORC01_06114 [Colletotrichum orchidophilum]|uniref:C2H2-type domain-containing protein n=1 Tax=Colletotrichum orchidophilum TaxID=1209926 RepID=A0A1G4BB85_9PEZI|nr:uncharacterized protein CORC01_06114 [Colletotrichum orchidophilum]OHE98663.1 hypothetical protein CORC01_06114 [Colletotrichum orchidophilum]